MAQVHTKVQISLGNNGRPHIVHTVRASDGTIYRESFDLDKKEDLRKVLQESRVKADGYFAWKRAQSDKKNAEEG